jgi:hypothetical protein
MIRVSVATLAAGLSLTSAAVATEILKVGFLQDKHIAPLNTGQLHELLRRHTLVFHDLQTGKETKVYYDDDPKEDVANRYDSTGKVIPWSVDGNFVFEETSDDSFRKFAVYRYAGSLYVCGYHDDDMCRETIAQRLDGNKL